MCDMLPDVVVSMTPHMKMGYVEVETAENPIFKERSVCRGQKFHFSDLIGEMKTVRSSPFIVTPQHQLAKVESSGYMVQNVVASYLHLHWSSNPSLTTDFMESAMRTSPIRKAFAVSFVSSATEIAFLLGAGGTLAGVTSICDYPSDAKSYPRQVDVAFHLMHLQ
jgi:hypothetical protein